MIEAIVPTKIKLMDELDLFAAVLEDHELEAVYLRLGEERKRRAIAKIPPVTDEEWDELCAIDGYSKQVRALRIWRGETNISLSTAWALLSDARAKRGLDH